MFGMSLFNSNEDIISLASKLETIIESNLADPHYGEKAIAVASRIKNHVVTNEVGNAVRVRVLSLINRAKLRALSFGTMDSYRVFTALDSISGDLLRI